LFCVEDIQQVIEFLGITLLGAVIIGLIKCAKKDVKDAYDGFYKNMGDDK
jgi:hypothetical protein